MDKRGKQTFPSDKNTNHLAFIISAVCFNTTPNSQVRPMPTNIDNGLPAVIM